MVKKIQMGGHEGQYKRLLNSPSWAFLLRSFPWFPFYQGKVLWRSILSTSPLARYEKPLRSDGNRL